MTFEVFNELITTLKKVEEKSFAAHELGIDLIEFETDHSHATWLAIRAHYGKAASEWIEWFLYERESLNGSINQAWDENGKEICNTVESLWETVEQMRKSEDFKEYTLPVIEEFNAEEFMERFSNFIKPRKDE